MSISAAGFGCRINWEDDEPPSGHFLSFKRSVEIASTGLLIRVLCPKWIFEWAPTKKIREVRDGFAEFRVCSLRARPCTAVLRLRIVQSYLAEMIDERKFSNEEDEKRDLLSNLVDANEELLEDGEQKIGEAELIGVGSALHLWPIC